MTTFSGEEYCKISKYKCFIDWRQNKGHEHSVARGNGSQGTKGFLLGERDRMVGAKHEKANSWDTWILGTWAFMLRRAREVWPLKEVRCNADSRVEWMCMKEMRMQRSLVNSWRKSTKGKRERFSKMGNRRNLVLRNGTWELYRDVTVPQPET